MDKIKFNELLDAFTALTDFCATFYDCTDPEQVDKVDNSLNILYKQLFEEGDR